MSQNVFMPFFAVVCISLFVFSYTGKPAVMHTEADHRDALLALLEARAAAGTEIDARAKTTACKVQGPYPDHACTPGAVFPNADRETICVKGYTKTVRNVTTKTKQRVYAAYGIKYPPPTGSYEMDHLIPLALGGNNDVANLFPEAKEPPPGFPEKDVVEIYLYEQMCKGAIDLAVAQKQIAEDWLAVYNTISTTERSQIRQRYKSWAN